MQSLIIHMASATARKDNVNTLLSTLPNAHVVEAETGLGHTTYPGTLHEPHYPFALSPGEVGCARSHRKCWQWIIDQDVEYALICEDDLSLDPTLWEDSLVLIEQSANRDSFIRLPAKNRETPVKVFETTDSAKLFLPKMIGLQTVCQVVGQNAARRLLNATTTLDRPVDTLLQMHWVHHQPIHTIYPNGVAELTATLGGSTIQKKSSSSGKLAREFKRWRYRSLIQARPQTA